MTSTESLSTTTKSECFGTFTKDRLTSKRVRAAAPLSVTPRQNQLASAGGIGVGLDGNKIGADDLGNP